VGKGKRTNKGDLLTFLTKGAKMADRKVVNRILDIPGGKKGKVEIVTRGSGIV
jgi:hypothetical protein